MHHVTGRTPPPLNDYAIADTGTTGHYLQTDSPHLDRQTALDPITVRMPNGAGIQSSHTCTLNLPNLPAGSKQAHILPGLASHSLLSIAKFCDHGCIVQFSRDRCRILKHNNVLLEGPRDPTTNLWLLPLRLQPQALPSPSPSAPHLGFAAHHTSTKPELIQYLHAACFSPVTSTWLRAIRNNNFVTWPGVSTQSVNKHLPKSIATAQGHLDQAPKNRRSTKPKPTPDPPSIIARPDRATGQPATAEQEQTDVFPPQQPTPTHSVFAAIGLADVHNRVIYTDLTGAFPVTSQAGNKYMLILYEYDSNAILVEPMKNRGDAEALRAYRQLYGILTDHGLQPKLNILDNEASKALKRAIRQTGANLQLVEPNNHRVNAAERAVRTFKNHFIAGLCSTNPRFPVSLWDKLLPQAVLTLNLLRTSRLNPNLSAHAQIFGLFDYNKTPLAPPGTRALIFEDPDTRQSWAPHGKEAWYIGPAMEHYRCYTFYIPETNGTRISGTAEFFPHHCHMPTISPADTVAHAAQDLVRALTTTTVTTPFPPLPPQHLDALRQLAKIFRTATEPPPCLNNTPSPLASPSPPRVHSPSPPRVDSPSPPRVDSPSPPRVPAPPLAPTHATARFQIRPPTHRFPTRNTQRDQAMRLRNRSLFSGAAIQALSDAEDQRLLEHYANAVIDPKTGRTLSYEDLVKDPKTRDLWSKAMTKELARLAQGIEGLTEGTNTVVYMTHDEIHNIPKDRTVTYARTVVDFRPQKADPNRVRITVGGNLITYPGEVTTRTADMVTSKILWNSVVSTPGAKYCCADVKNFYLETPMDRYEYMRIPLRTIPDAFIEAYDLKPKIYKGYLYMEIRKGMYGLPQAGILANQLLRQRLKPHGYFEVTNTPGLWKHVTRPTTFTLVVDDFGIKYVGDEHAHHLIDTLSKYYTVETDWSGSLYCGIQLQWNYAQHFVDLSMPKYVNNKRHEYNHGSPARPQHSPYPAAERRYGTSAQDTVPPDETPALDADGKTRIQKIVGSFLYYGRAVDITILKALNSLSRQQSSPTQATATRTDQLLDYLATHPNATVRFYASDMLLQVHSDASYLNEPDGRSTAGGHYFLGKLPIDNQPIFLNGAIYALCTILKHVAASAAEAELGALFLNTQEVKILRLILEEMGHPQPPTPIHCDNSTAVGIANSTVKRQRSRAMEMRYFWIIDQVRHRYVRILWHPGMENLGDYVTKHHSPKHHQHVRPYYTQQPRSPRELTRALKPSVLRGCVNPARTTQQSRMPLTRGRPRHTSQDTCHPAHNPISYQSLLSRHNLVRT
jgi:hypothetical protein